LGWNCAGAGNAGHGLWRILEPEEGDGVAIANIEEEVLTNAARQVQGLEQRHAEHIAIEGHRAGHVLADQGQMVDAAKFKLTIFRTGHGGLPEF
jgi:hypothetical protein